MSDLDRVLVEVNKHNQLSLNCIFCNEILSMVLHEQYIAAVVNRILHECEWQKNKYWKLSRESVSVTIMGMNKRHFQQTSFINEGSVMLYISNIFVFIIFSNISFCSTHHTATFAISNFCMQRITHVHHLQEYTII